MIQVSVISGEAVAFHRELTATLNKGYEIQNINSFTMLTGSSPDFTNTIVYTAVLTLDDKK